MKIMKIMKINNQNNIKNNYINIYLMKKSIIKIYLIIDIYVHK